MRRQLFLWHRYLGIALCLLFIVWFVSGVVMLYVRMPILFPAERLSYLAPFNPAEVRISPADAAASAGLAEPPRRIRLVSFNGRPVYYVLPRGQRWIGIYADTGARVGTVTPAMASALVSRIAGTGARHLDTVEAIDQWTLTNSLNLLRPLHRVAVADAAATELYVSSMTGEIVMRTTRRDRLLAWFGPIPHWIAPEVLRNHVPAWRQIVLWASGAGILLTLTGIWLGVSRYRRRGYPLRSGRSRSPYVGWKRWHHWAGLAFGAITLTWMVSGWLYLNPGGNRSGPLETITTMSPYNVGGVRADNSSRPEHAAALTGGPLLPSLFSRSPAGAWRAVASGAMPREIELTRVGGRPYYVFFGDWNQSWIVPADDEAGPARTQLDRDAFTALAARMVPGARLTEAVYRERYDAFYYSVGAVAPKRMPVLLVKFDDPDRTWYYLDPYTGGILRRYDRYGRVMRWVVNGLHTLDFPFLFEHRPAWDLTIILLSAGGLALTLTGLIIGWRRVSPSGAAKQQEKAA
jgi:uncharacterized iron-regulated membrane protein